MGSLNLALTPLIQLKKKKNAIASIVTIIDRELKKGPRDDSGLTLEDVRREVGVHHVSFKYPTRLYVKIFCLTINSCKVVSFKFVQNNAQIVFSSKWLTSKFPSEGYKQSVYADENQRVEQIAVTGSEKSTIISVLWRFYDPDPSHYTYWNWNPKTSS